MRKAFVFKLYKTKRNKRLHEQIECASFVYNYCIALYKRYFKLFGKYLNKYKLQKHITKLKKQKSYSHWTNVPSQAIQDITDRIDRAYQLFFKHGKADKVKPPSFKKRSKYKSITLKQTGYKLLEDNKIKIGKKEFKFFKSRDIEGSINTLTIKRDPLGDIYLCFACEVEGADPSRVMTGKNAGFDFGLKTFLTSSDGIKIESPYFFKRGINDIKRASKHLSTKKRGSRNRKKAAINLARCHKKIAHQRKDYHHKLAQKLAQNYDHLFFESLCIKGMQRIWGRKISDLGFSDFLSTLKYCCQRFHGQLYLIDKFYPSSKTCHVCQNINQSLSLSDRIWQCSACNTMHDRDINAAINIQIVGASTIGLGNVRPNDLAFPV